MEFSMTRSGGAPVTGANGIRFRPLAVPDSPAMLPFSPAKDAVSAAMSMTATASPSPARYSLRKRPGSAQQQSVAVSPALSSTSRMSFGSVHSDGSDEYSVQRVELSQDFGSVSEVMAKLQQQELNEQQQHQQDGDEYEEEHQSPTSSSVHFQFNRAFMKFYSLFVDSLLN
jgi:hypothetical protein